MLSIASFEKIILKKIKKIKKNSIRLDIFLCTNIFGSLVYLIRVSSSPHKKGDFKDFCIYMLNSNLTILFSWQYLEFSFTCIYVYCIFFWNLTWIGQICAEKLSQLPIQYWSVITTESIWIEGVSLYHIFKLNFIGLWSGLSFAVRQGDFAEVT